MTMSYMDATQQHNERTKSALIRIVDNNMEVRESLSFMLRREGFETAVYDSAEAFLTQDMPSRPGCVLLDVRMDGMSGLECQAEMQRRAIRLPVIFLSGFGTIEMAVKTMQKGAVAFIEKSADRTKVLDAVFMALEAYPELMDPEADLLGRWASLTPREQDVVTLVAQGLLNREIGERLGIAAKTVQVHRGEACNKLGVKGAAGLTQALRWVQKAQSSLSGAG